MKAALPTPRRMAALLFACACNLAVWMLGGLFATSEFYRRALVMGGAALSMGEALWNEGMFVQMCTALIWAVFTPAIVYIARRLPLRRPHLLRNAAIVIALIPLLAVTRAAAGSVVMNLGEHHPVAISMLRLSLSVRTHRNIAILAAIFFICNLFEAQRETARRERQRVRTQTLLARAELDDLRTRL
ncbi:MAG TPA: hypothetical protein VND45_06870, partial [Thermoanaerobaculia bacterium]|nr:hypothetical protein [Thermoanaerobaculia bacterium]